MKKVLSLFLFCTLVSGSFSQSLNQARIDSLLRKLNEFSESDTNRMNALLALTTNYLSLAGTEEDWATAMNYAAKAKHIADSLKDKKGSMGVFSLYGLHYQLTGNFAKALEQYLEA